MKNPWLLSPVSQTPPTRFPPPEHKQNDHTQSDTRTHLASGFLPHQEGVFTGAATNWVDSSGMALSLVVPQLLLNQLLKCGSRACFTYHTRWIVNTNVVTPYKHNHLVFERLDFEQTTNRSVIK